MGILSIFKSGPKAIEAGTDIAKKATDGIISGIDKAWFTDEEKSDASVKILELNIDLIKSTMNESSVRSITRRLIAIIILSDFVIMLTGSAIIWRFDSEWAAHVLKCALSLSAAVTAIVIFYFGYYAGINLIGKWRENKNGG